MEEKLILKYEDENFELSAQSGDWILSREKGYSPVQMIASAVGACAGYVYVSILNNSTIPHVMKAVDVTYSRSENKTAAPIDKIEVVLYASVEEEYQDRARRCVSMIAKNCPVIQTLDPTIKVEEIVKFV